MALSEERLNRWRDRRIERMSRLGLIRTQPSGGGAPAYYVADELLVRDEHRQAARDAFARLGHRADDTVEASVAVGGFRRYRTRDLDVLAAAETIGRQARADGDRRPAAAVPNHIFLSAPFEHGGPFGPPVAAPAAVVLPEVIGPMPTDRTRVAVIDTGIWLDSPLPPGYYTATPSDFESDVDVDDDGVIDGDVGHANFIAGVIAQHTSEAEIRIVRLLDTFGVCTEADLVAALGKVDADTTVVNLSLGGFTVDDQAPQPLAEALAGLLGQGNRLVVAASGNDGARDRPFWPAAFAGASDPWADYVVAVTAHDGDGLCSWANTGPWVTLAAPGADVCSTYVHHPQFASGWAQWSGTSFATPYVVAAIVDRLQTGSTPQAALQAVLSEAKQRYGSYPGIG